jgi:virginiamycin A acetyltransferase
MTERPGATLRDSKYEGAESLHIDPTAEIDHDARIYPSVKGTQITIGARVWLGPFVVVKAVGGLGDVTIDADSFINPHCVLYSGNGIRIGRQVLIAAHVSIMPTNHAISRLDLPIKAQGFAPSRGGVVIEDNVWVGAGSVLLDGAYVESGAVVGAGSVVSARIPANTVWAGVPARQIGIRT